MATGETYARLREAVDHVGFRDWLFIVGCENNTPLSMHGYHGFPLSETYYLQVEFEAPNASCKACEGTGRDLRERMACRCISPQRGRKWRLSEHMTRSEVVQTVLCAVLAAVEHEAREDFRYDGAVIFGPHFNVDVLHAVARSDGALDLRR